LLLLSCLVELGDFPLECLGNGVLLPGVAAEPNEREETIRFAVLGFAGGEAGESPERPPVCRVWIGIVATCQRLRDECSVFEGDETMVGDGTR
jgi:hypothetical protein